MDYKIIWSDLAITDLHGICAYIAEDNPNAAERVGRGILGCVEILRSFPFIGPSYPRGSGGTLREITSRPYRIFYDVSDSDKAIEILHIRHSARDEPEL